MIHAGLGSKQEKSGLVFGFQHFSTTVKTGWTDVMTQVRFASGGLHCNARDTQGIVRAVHAALGWGLFVLLDGHDPLLRVIELEEM